MAFFWLTLLWRLHVQCLQIIQDTCRPITVITYYFLLLTPCYANKFFNICLCIIMNTNFLTDCLTTIYYIILYYIILYYFYFTLIYVLSLFTHLLVLITSQERGGCYPGLTSVTHIHDWDLRLTRFQIDRSNSIMSIDLSLIYSIYIHTYSIIMDYTIFAFPLGSCR